MRNSNNPNQEATDVLHMPVGAFLLWLQSIFSQRTGAAKIGMQEGILGRIIHSPSAQAVRWSA
jgi:DNA segregation ATPase FtsK/SpoIIIE-like protein